MIIGTIPLQYEQYKLIFFWMLNLYLIVSLKKYLYLIVIYFSKNKLECSVEIAIYNIEVEKIYGMDKFDLYCNNL